MDIRYKILKCIKGFFLFLSIISVIIIICDEFVFSYKIRQIVDSTYNFLMTLPFLLFVLVSLIISIILVCWIVNERKKKFINEMKEKYKNK